MAISGGEGGRSYLERCAPPPTRRAAPLKRRALTFPQWTALLAEALDVSADSFSRGRGILARAADGLGGFWRDWVELALAVRLSNPMWAGKAAARILKTGRHELSFGPPPGGGGGAAAEAAGPLAAAIAGLAATEGGGDLARMLAGKMAELDGELRPLGPRFRAGWSLSELRRIGEGGRLAGEFFDFWHRRLAGRSSEAEMEAFLGRAITAKVLRRASVAQLLVYAVRPLPAGGVRAALLERLVAAWSSGDLRQRFVVLECLRGKGVRRSLGRRVPELARPRAQVARRYFREVLASGQAAHFALYHLARLGETDPALPLSLPR